MAQIKLTDKFYVDPETIAVIKQTARCGGSVEIRLKGDDGYSEVIPCEEATEAWANWIAYADQTKV